MAEKLLANPIDFVYLPTASSFQFLTDQETRLLASAKVVEVLQPELTALHSALAFFDNELKRSAKNLKDRPYFFPEDLLWLRQEGPTDQLEHKSPRSASIGRSWKQNPH